MGTRSRLRKQLWNAWEETILEQYQNQRINSERGLQVFFCSALIAQFGSANRRVFVEPTLKAKGESGPIPDVLICNSHRVIGVVELKYLPRGQARFKKDVQTLEWCSSNSGDIRIKNTRYKGRVRDERAYALATDAVLCWAGVYSGAQKVDLEEHLSQSVKRCFLGLHALTRPDDDPIIDKT